MAVFHHETGVVSRWQTLGLRVGDRRHAVFVVEPVFGGGAFGFGVGLGAGEVVDALELGDVPGNVRDVTSDS